MVKILNQAGKNLLRDAIGLPKTWSGVINDTASVGTICSLLTAREVKTNFSVNKKGLKHNKFIIYTSKEAHSSVEKGVKIIGLGSDNLRKIEINDDLSMNLEKLEFQMDLVPEFNTLTNF